SAGPLGPARTVSTAPKNTLWLPTDLTSTMRQSNAITAEARTGLPVDSVSQSPRANRSPPAMPVRPENMSAISAPPSPSVLTQNPASPPRTGLVGLRGLGQRSGGGGASETEQPGVGGAPALPRGPGVVMTWTAAPSRLIASRKPAGSTVRTGSGPTAVKA